MYEVLITCFVLAHTVFSAVWTANTCLLLSNKLHVPYKTEFAITGVMLSCLGHVTTICNEEPYYRPIHSLLGSYMYILLEISNKSVAVLRQDSICTCLLLKLDFWKLIAAKRMGAWVAVCAIGQLRKDLYT